MRACRDCRVERGYRPMLDYVALCPLHAAASDLLTALNRAAKLAHKNTRNHPQWLSFRECKQETCVTATAAIKRAETIAVPVEESK